MNAYVTVDDLNLRYDWRASGQLSNDSNSLQGNQNILNTLLDDSASEFESYIDQRYAVATVRSASPMPNRIKSWICNKTIAMLYARRGRIPSEITAQLKIDQDWIEKVQKGQINLPTILRAAAPQLESTSRPDGSSAFNADFGWQASPYGPEQCISPAQPTGPLAIPGNVD